MSMSDGDNSFTGISLRLISYIHKCMAYIRWHIHGVGQGGPIVPWTILGSSVGVLSLKIVAHIRLALYMSCLCISLVLASISIRC